MGDRMYASEGDSGYVARLGSGWHGDVRTGDPWESGPPAHPQADDATAEVARRLQGRLDRHLWLLDRLAEQLRPETAELPELLDTAARMRRDTESLLLLGGHEPGVHPGGPRQLEELMADAAGLTEEPHRVSVRPAPRATVDPSAAVELMHVLAEFIDHTTEVHPNAYVELAARIESGGATVDVVVDGAGPQPMNGGHAAAADQLAQFSRYGIVLHRPLGGPPPSGSGLVASVHCPPASVAVEAPPPPPPPPPPPVEPPVSRSGGMPQYVGAPGPLDRDPSYDGTFDRGYDRGFDSAYDQGYEKTYDQGYDDGFGALPRRDDVRADTGGFAPPPRRDDAGPGTGGFAPLPRRDGGSTGGFAPLPRRDDPGTGTGGFAPLPRRDDAGTGGFGAVARGDDLGGTGGYAPLPRRDDAGTNTGGFSGLGAGLGAAGLGTSWMNDLGSDPHRSGGNGLGTGTGSGSVFGDDGGFGSGFGTGSGNGSGNGNGNGHGTGNGNGLGNGYGNGNGLGNGYGNGNGLGNGHGNGNGNGNSPFDAPSYSPSSSSQVDELFGPLLDLPLEPIDDRYATPIFEAIASAWFKEGEAEAAGEAARVPMDWETPQDNEWREAAARAARSEPLTTTATGLPRRRPGTQLVPPPRAQSNQTVPAPGVGERVPDRVRDRLSTYQRGLRQGRHRAPGEENPEPEGW